MNERSLQTVNALNAIVVTNDEDAERATNVVKEAKEFRLMVEKERDEYVAPAKQIIENAKRVYDPIINQVKVAEQKVRNAIQFYLVEKEKKRKIEEDKIAAKVEVGKLKPETAVRKLENLGESKKSVSTGGATLGIRKTKDIKVVDESLIPKEYWVVDLVKVRKVALAGVEIPGVKVVEKISTSLR